MVRELVAEALAIAIAKVLQSWNLTLEFSLTHALNIPPSAGLVSARIGIAF